MSDERQQTGMDEKASAGPEADLEDDDDDVGSPFDHPAFLPVLLLALSVWFGFDGWFSETIEAVNFNRYGFFFLLSAAGYFALAEIRPQASLPSLLWGGWAIWLAIFWQFGPEDAWWRENPEGEMLTPMVFNQWGALACAVVAVVLAVRAALWGRASESSAAGGSAE